MDERHSRDYERPRKANAFNHEFTVCYPGEGVAGSKIALLGCPSARTLDTIAAVELAEGLPHMTRNGKWFRTMPGVRYLSFEFSEETIDDFIKVALASGIKAIQHPAPWETWGHLEPKKTQFPNGRAGFKACVDKVHKAGLEFFLGTLASSAPTMPTLRPSPTRAWRRPAAANSPRTSPTRTPSSRSPTGPRSAIPRTSAACASATN